MTDATVAFRPVSANRALLWGALLLLLAGVFFVLNLQGLLPVHLWIATLGAGDAATLPQLMARDVLLPRFAVGLLAGAGLGLAGLLFQQVLRNPLAEPGTLGVFAGAKCALVIVTLWFPGLLFIGWDVIAFAGGASVTLLVLVLAARHGFAPASVIISGLVISLCLGSLGSLLMMTHFDAVNDLYLWEAGSLVQNNWSVVRALLPRLVAAAVLAVVMARSFGLLDLDAEGARSLGVPVLTTRLIGLGLAVLISASVAGLVGLVSFIGLAGPALARHMGARRFRDRLWAGPLIAAGLLTLTDQSLVFLFGTEVPAGAVSAVIGAPLLIWLLSSIRPGAESMRAETRGYGGFAADTSIAPRLLLTLVLLAALIILALSLGRGPQGWQFAWGQDLADLLPWRLPRVAVAAAAGCMLALAGVFLQKITANPLASPEVLGISAGAGLVLIVASFLLPGLDRLTMIVIAALGAFAMLVLVLWLSRRSAFAGAHLLLIGVALSSLMGSLLVYLTFLGDPRILRVLSWLSGSTYAVTAAEATVIALLAVLSLLLAPLAGRFLAILPLGPAIARELGLGESGGRLILLAATAVLTGATTLIAGPLSFIGLMAPHLARLAGFRKPVALAYGAALIGAILLVGADWLGRMVAFPWQVPAGFVCTIIGAAFYVTLLARR